MKVRVSDQQNIVEAHNETHRLIGHESQSTNMGLLIFTQLQLGHTIIRAHSCGKNNRRDREKKKTVQNKMQAQIHVRTPFELTIQLSSKYIGYIEFSRWICVLMAENEIHLIFLLRAITCTERAFQSNELTSTKPPTIQQKLYTP